MPPKRKSTGSRAAPPSQQSTLSFHGKQNKVTKLGSAKHAKDRKKDPALVEDIVRTEIKAEAEPDLEEPTTAEKAIQQQSEHEAATLDSTPDPLQHDGDDVKTADVLGGVAQANDAGAVGGKGSGWVGDEAVDARKITDTQIKRYWREKENERLAPRVHQEDLTVYEKLLREWDMSGQYGVSLPPHLETNISRISAMLTNVL